MDDKWLLPLAVLLSLTLTTVTCTDASSLCSNYPKQANVTKITYGHLPAGLPALYCEHNPVSHVSDDAFRASADTLWFLEITHGELDYIPDLHYLTTLKRLNLGWNRINNADSVSLPGSLQYLTLYHNFLTQIPAQVSKLNNLHELNLANNTIRNIDTFLFPSTLTYIDLGDNKIENISSISFTQDTSSLKTLSLYGNPLKRISTTAFAKMPRLDWLNLYSTHLTRLPLALMAMTHVTFVDLNYNINNLDCTCGEAALSAWYRTLPADNIIMGRCIAEHGETWGSREITYFLNWLAPNCPTEESLYPRDVNGIANGRIKL